MAQLYTLTLASYSDKTKKLIVENGGKLVITGPSAILDNCPETSNWGGVEVREGGSLEINQGKIYSAVYAVRALAGSNVYILDLEADGENHIDNKTGLVLDGAVNANYLKNIKIKGYTHGIKAYNNKGYYNFNQGEIDCKYGIELWKASSSIYDFKINATDVGIGVYSSQGVFVSDNQIRANNIGVLFAWSNSSAISGNEIGLEYRDYKTGIFIHKCYGGQVYNNNRIYSSETGIYASYTDYSIINNSINTLGSKLADIGGVFLTKGNNNQIKNNSVEVFYGTYGIKTISSHQTEITYNAVHTEADAPAYRAASIKSEGCTGQTIKNNNVFASYNCNGVLVNNTTGNTFDCNDITTDSLGNALDILYNSEGQSVKGNSLNGDNKDLTIYSPIGNQVYTGNKFIGGSAYAKDNDIVNDSKFFVNENISKHMPTDINISGWFLHSDNYNPYTCADPSTGPNEIPFWDEGEVLCSYYLNIVNTYGYNSMEYARMAQTMLRHQQNVTDFTLPSCIKNDGQLPQCWEKIVNAEYLLNGLDTTNINQRSELFELIEALNTAYQNGTSENFLAQNKAHLESLITTVENSSDHYQQQINEASNLLNEVNCESLIANLAVGVLQENIKYLATENKDSFNFEPLISYSRLCADKYGAYINLARGLTHEVNKEIYDQYDNCPLNQDAQRITKDKELQKNSSSTLFPTPSNGLVTVNFGKRTSGLMEVIDLSGRVILKTTYTNSTHLDLNLSDHQGMNIIHLYHKDGTVEVLKHLTIH